VVGAPQKQATLADFLAIPEEDRFHEIIDGELVQKAQPTPRHGGAQVKLAAALDPCEVDVLFSGAPLRPDLSGWRRERMPELPATAFAQVTPDWVCEVLSSHRARDTVRKQRIYRRHGVGHYWLLDSENETLTVLR